jgi:hypothetical protein
MDHRILCIEVEEGGITALGTGGEDGVAHRRWLPAELRRAITEGERFYVTSPTTGWEADLVIGETGLLAAFDDLGEDCLHGLRGCRWR